MCKTNFFFNRELIILNRRRQREYNKNGKSVKYEKLAEEFLRKYKSASKSYNRNKVDELKDAEPGKASGVLKSMGAKPGDCTDGATFTLPSHQEGNLLYKESCEKRAQHLLQSVVCTLPLTLAYYLIVLRQD